MTSYKIIDNFLPIEQFTKLQDKLLSKNFPWFYNDFVTSEKVKESNFYFTHLFYQQYHINSEYYDLVKPIVDILKPEAIIRIKANLYLQTKEIVYHDKHVDYFCEHDGAIFYVNNNNGKTILEDDTEIESVANRLLTFNSGKPHNSTSSL